MIKLNNINKIYNKTIYALKNVSITFPDKGMVCIVGKSGSGKTTLLNILSGTISIDEGSYLIDGLNTKNFSPNNWSEARTNYFGYVFQNYNLFESNTVYENLKLATLNLDYEVSDSKIDEILKSLDIYELKNKLVNELSGGEKQRVSIARTIAKDSKVILADEPTGALDYENAKNVFEILKKLSKDRLVIVVTHDYDFSNQYSDYIVKLSYGEVIENNIEYIDNNNDFKILKDKKYTFKDMLDLKQIIIKNNLIKNVFSIILYSLLVMIICISLHISFFNEEEYIYNVIKENNITYNYVTINPTNLFGLEHMYEYEDEFSKYKYDIVFKDEFNLKSSKLFGINHSNSIFDNIIVDDSLMDNQIVLTDYSLDQLKLMNVIDFNEYEECKNKVLDIFNIELVISNIEITNYMDHNDNKLYEETVCIFTKINSNTLKKFVNYSSFYYYDGYIYQSECNIKYYDFGEIVGENDLNGNEIVVSDAVIWKVFEGSIEEFNLDYNNACQKYIGKSILINNETYIIKGITTEEGLKITYSNECFDSIFDYNEIELCSYRHLYRIDINNFKEFKEIMKLLRENRFYLLNYYNRDIIDVAAFMNGHLSTIIMIFSFILFAVLIVFVFFTNKVYIKNNKKNIGILKLLGYKKNNINACYYYSNSIIVIVALIIGILTSLIFIGLVNNYLVPSLTIDIINPNALIYLLVGLFIYGVSMVSLSIMLKLLSRYDIINLINKE